MATDSAVREAVAAAGGAPKAPVPHATGRDRLMIAGALFLLAAMLALRALLRLPALQPLSNQWPISLRLVMGFALQTPITSLLAWVYMLVRRPSRIGDRIRVGEMTGDVIGKVDHLEVNERPTMAFRIGEHTWVEAIVRYLVHPKEAGRVKTRLIVKLLQRLNEHPDKVRFPKADLR